MNIVAASSRPRSRALGFTTALDRQWGWTAYALRARCCRQPGPGMCAVRRRLGGSRSTRSTFLHRSFDRRTRLCARRVGRRATSGRQLPDAESRLCACRISLRPAQHLGDQPFDAGRGACLPGRVRRASRAPPAALSILSTTFSDPKERGKAFGAYGAIVGAGGAIGLSLGGILTEYLSWRWCLYVNLIFAVLAATGAVTLLRHQASHGRSRLDLPGVALVSASMFCLVYGFSNAAAHNWHTPSTYGFLAGGVALLAAFALWQARAASPLLPPRVVLDRNRGGAFLAVLIAGAGMFGIFLFLIYYMQQTLGYSPVITGVAFLPMIAMVVVSANLANVVLLPRLGPKPLVTAGMLLAAGSLAWLTRIGMHSGYASAVLGPLIAAGLSFGFTIAPSMNIGTSGVAPADAGMASATLNTGQQIGGSIGTALLNTIFASAMAHYLTGHLSTATLVHGHRRRPWSGCR